MADTIQTILDTRLQVSGQSAFAAALQGAAGLFVSFFARSAGQVEQVRIGLESALGSAEAASAKMRELSAFAEKSPFDFQGVAQGSQLLLGMGARAEQVIPIMKALGNAVAASGRGQEEFNRALLAVGQIISQTRLQGDELRQLAEAGVPLSDMLKELGVAYGEAGKRGITAEQATAALIKVMNQGRFAGAMEKQSRTLFGSFSALRDSVFQLGAALGEPLIGPLSAAARFLSGLANTLREMPGLVKGAVLALGSFGALRLGGAVAGRLAGGGLLGLLGLGGLGLGGAAAGAAKGAAAGGGLFGALGSRIMLAGLGITGAGLAAGAGISYGARALTAGRGKGAEAAGLLGGNVAGGALAGGVAGSIIPGIGTLGGALIGAVGGAIVSAIEAGMKKSAEATARERALGERVNAASPELLELRKMVAELQEQNLYLKGWRGAPMDVSGTGVRLPEADMARAIRGTFGW